MSVKTSDFEIFDALDKDSHAASKKENCNNTGDGKYPRLLSDYVPSLYMELCDLDIGS